VTMDMMLQTRAGGRTENIWPEHPTPILVVCRPTEGAVSTYNAMPPGRVDVMEKPRGRRIGRGLGRADVLGRRLVSRIR